MVLDVGRSTREVLDAHLRLRQEGATAEDVARHYAEDVVMLSAMGVHRGREGVCYLAGILSEQLPNASFTYRTLQVDGEYAFLEWTARADGARVKDGADSFVVRDGRIVMQSIHYTVVRE